MEFNVVQMFDAESCTLTYLLIDPATRQAVLVDPVDTQAERDLAAIEQHGARLVHILETHAHADHITSAGRLRELTGAMIAAPQACEIAPADIQLQDGDHIQFGNETLHVIHTPGHTAGSMCYLWRDNLLSGDTLLIGGCGRTDFQSGSAAAMYDSIVNRLFVLPDATKVYPGHDYMGNTVSSIGAEKTSNPRLAGKTRDEFVALMSNLRLPPPKMINVAVSANRMLGLVQGMYEI